MINFSLDLHPQNAKTQAYFVFFRVSVFRVLAFFAASAKRCNLRCKVLFVRTRLWRNAKMPRDCSETRILKIDVRDVKKTLFFTVETAPPKRSGQKTVTNGT